MEGYCYGEVRELREDDELRPQPELLEPGDATCVSAELAEGRSLAREA
jgi:hypothetical protein